jgi:3-phosphoglycerate kinase
MNKRVGFPKRSMRDVPLDGKTVLVRADYNVPLDDTGHIEDDFRLTQSLPTLHNLIERGCKIVICAHLGRPDGKVTPEFSLEPVAAYLAKLLGQNVAFIDDCVGDRVHQAAKRLAAGQVLMLENLRFHAGEEANDMTFAELLIKDTGAQYFVQDGFGVVHRAHASTSAVTHFAPSVAGLLLEREWESITTAMKDPKRPMVAVLGGAKISDKIKVIDEFVSIADNIVIGGAMANTFLKFKGYKIGKSVHEDGLDDIVKHIYAQAEKKVGRDAVDDFIILPTDVAVAAAIDRKARRTMVSVEDVAADEYILDMGPESIAAAVETVNGAGTVVWNGTLGYAEIEQFSYGSARMALALASQPETVSVIGGGDTADFVLHWDVAKKGGSFSHVSTGGGASIDLMAGEPMPGIEALLDA